MFFVDDDDAEIFKRREHGAPRPHRDFRFAAAKPPPFVEFLPRGKPAVHDRRIAPETGTELGEHLRRERNFRHQKNSGFALL